MAAAAPRNVFLGVSMPAPLVAQPPPTTLGTTVTPPPAGEKPARKSDRKDLLVEQTKCDACGKQYAFDKHVLHMRKCKKGPFASVAYVRRHVDFSAAEVVRDDIATMADMLSLPPATFHARLGRFKK